MALTRVPAHCTYYFTVLTPDGTDNWKAIQNRQVEDGLTQRGFRIRSEEALNK